MVIASHESGWLASPWRPEEVRFHEPKLVEAFRNDRTIQPFDAVEPWPLPAEPTWQEDPFNLATWRLYYYSLGWMHTLFADYAGNGDGSARDEAKRLLFAWMAAHPASEASELVEPWRDHPTAYRLANLVRFHGWLEPTLRKDESLALRTYIAAHAEYLIGLFALPQFVGNNHGFMDAMAVYTAGVAAGDGPEAKRWRYEARQRLSRLAFEMFDFDGVNIEQSFGYHFFALKLLFEAECALRADGKGLPSFHTIASKAIGFAAAMQNPDGTLPAIGDTPFRMSAAPLRSYARVVRPAEAGRSRLLLFRNAGYALIGRREDYVSVLFDFSVAPLVTTHGHRDTLSFVMFGGGRELIVDPGGPYAYRSDARTRFFVDGRAHNILLVDDRGNRPANGQFVAADDVGDRQSVTARTTVGYVRHERTITLAGGDTVIIDDRIISPGRHRYELLYHFPPDAEVALTGDRAAHVLVAGVSMKIEVYASEPVTASVVAGEKDETWQGWVTPANLKMEPAPVLSFAATEAGSMRLTTVLTVNGGGLPVD